MFSALRTSSPVYVLDKGGEPMLKNGSVATITAPQPKIGTQFTLNPETTVDITIKYDDGTTNDFKQVPSMLSIANFGNMVISETKELMSQEVESMIRNSTTILDSVDYHKKIVEKCKEMLKDLNPVYAEKQKTEERLNKLETSIYDIRDMLSKVLNINDKKKE